MIIEKCPFCGKDAKLKDILTPYRHGWVGCPECGIYKQWSYRPEEAIEKWNSRPNTCVLFDKEETYHNCAVQVLINTETGETSWGWWKE